MTIQVSVIVWTVICFIALALILDRLLFRPMLSFMDSRREKIDRAKSARDDALRQRQEELDRREQARAAASRQAMLDAAAALETTREENARRLSDRRAELEVRREADGEVLAARSRALLAEAEPREDELVAALAERLQLWPARTPEEARQEETAAPHAAEDPADASGPEE